ncbi:expressed unknown protein [Seminavis robusta]|uniref:RanBP2-type domain-containing protein n=1 Tax=Seminavis robusta TaxID=568900 RepID=A0A9N8H1L5_9STRA|nr:expressed unknown protein [Seminavis robusta]|eukprot:Sro43_g026250.1 n/a (371) ;mRNA; f:95767-96879
MQHQHTEDLTNEPNTKDTAATATMKNDDQEQIDIEASLSRIGVLSDSLAALTRKRPSGDGNGGRRVQRRPSLGSSVTSGSSIGIDDLVNNLEGLEFEMLCNNPNENGLDLSISRLSMNDSVGSHHTGGGNNESTARLSMGLWSLQDMEPWACATCTFENEPVFSVCEMCGQCRPPPRQDYSNNNNNNSSLMMSNNNNSNNSMMVDHARRRVDSTVLVMQEQRMMELQQFKAPPSRSMSPRPPRAAARKRSEPPPPRHPPKGRSPKRHGSTRRSSSPVPPTTNLLNPSLHSLSSTTYNREASMRDLFADSSNHSASLHKTSRLQDSFTTATTFDMSASSFDYFPPERIAIPGIEEEEDRDAVELDPNSAEC